MMFWNQAFDIKYFLDRIRVLNADPKDIICSPDFPVKEVYYFPDAGIFDVKKKKDYLKASCYTNYIDQMINYVKIRAGGGEMRSHALNAVGQKELQDTNQFSRKMVAMEDCKMLPIGAVWAEYCRQCGVVDAGYYDEIEAYENEVLLKRV